MVSAVIDRVRLLLEAADGPRVRVLQMLFATGVAVSREAAEQGLRSSGVDDLVAAGLARKTPDGLVGLMRMTRFQGVVVTSDRLDFRHHADFVIGPGPSSSLLADAVGPIDDGRVLDLGCGPGTQALWLARERVEAIGIDINPRALSFAAFNRDLNRQRNAAFEIGDFLTAPPDSRFDEQFDVVVANPPFVLAPASVLRYRDRQLPGHDTTKVSVERVVRALAPGGRGYVLGTWLDDARGRWDGAPRSWLRGSGCRALVSRVASVAPAAYAMHWTRDLPDGARATAVDEWTAALESEGARRITTGLIALMKPARRRWMRRPAVTAVDHPHPNAREIQAALA